MFCSTFRTLDLSPGVVHQSIQTRFGTETVLTRQQTWISVTIQTNTAGEQLFQLRPSACHFSPSITNTITKKKSQINENCQN